jgi:hypothetical protein
MDINPQYVLLMIAIPVVVMFGVAALYVIDAILETFGL